MVHVENVVVIPFPADQVFDFLADGLNEPEWRPDVRSISHVSGEGVGATYAQTMAGPGGRAIAGDFRFTEFVKPSRLVFEVIAGPARPVGTFSLNTVGDGSTTVTFSLDIEVRGLMRLMGRMIEKTARAEVANLDNVAAAMASR